MYPDTTIDLNECTEFRQALRGQTPGIVHGSAFLLIALLAAATTWMALTRANLVVTGAGRVRPVSNTETDDDQISREISSQRDGRVLEVNAKVGDEVKAGQVLVRLDTTELDLQIEKTLAIIAAGKQKLTELDRSVRLLTERYSSAAQKARAEIDESRVRLELRQQGRANEIALAEIALVEAKDKAARARNLAAQRVVPQEQLVEATSRWREAEEKLRKAQLPLHDGQTEVLRRNLELIGRDYAVEKQKLAVERRTKQDEIEASTYDLAKLELQKNQAVVRAPSDCLITTSDVKVGDMVRSGKLGITTARRCGFEFDLEVPSADVAHLRRQMPVQIKMDAYDYQKYGTLNGIVRFVAPDSTLKKAGEKQIAIYKVKVDLQQRELRRGSHRGAIKLGMTGRAEVVTDSESILLILLRKIHRKISLG